MNRICRTHARLMRWWSFQTKKITFALGVFDNHSNIVTWYQFFNCSTLLSLPYCKLRWFGRKRSYVFLDWKTVKISFCLWFFRHVKIRLVPVNRTTFICHFRPNGPSHVTNRIMVWFRNSFTGKCYRLLEHTN